MSFHYLPGQFRVPKIPNLTLPDGVWCGADSDAGLYAFDAGSSWGGRIISKAMCYSLYVGGSKLSPVHLPRTKSQSNHSCRDFCSFSAISPNPPIDFSGQKCYINATFHWGCYALKRKVRYKMATSSITANFYTDDPKAANAIVHALFTETSSPRRMPPRSRFEVKHTPAGDKAFFERLKSKLERERACVGA